MVPANEKDPSSQELKAEATAQTKRERAEHDESRQTERGLSPLPKWVSNNNSGSTGQRSYGGVSRKR
jgi:hypothetical protein